jgi:hypothetical protein
MGPADVATFELIAGDLLEVLGYEVGGEASAAGAGGAPDPRLVAARELLEQVRWLHGRIEGLDRRISSARRRVSVAKRSRREAELRLEGTPERRGVRR